MTSLFGAVDGGRLIAPAAGGRVAMIDPADVAAAAAAVLIGGEHAGRTYRLTGPEAITFAQAAAALGLEYVDVPPEAARQGLAGAGLPAWLVDHLDGAFGLIRAGAFDEVTDTFRVLCGRDAHTIADFARRHPMRGSPREAADLPAAAPAWEAEPCPARSTSRSAGS
jgi:uncharacterized protein YbjT (DUF2867 family)